MTQQRAFIGLGSNLDHPQQQIESALRALGALPQTTLLAVSPLYQSLPWGDPCQDDFVNAVAMVDTELEALSLLTFLLDIERQQGRDRNSARRHGPRTLDLDLLLYGTQIHQQPQLQVPHPRMHERAFVLLPLADLAPGAVIPPHGSVSSLIQPEFASLCWRLPAASVVRRE